MTERNARFWEFAHGSPVKVTLRPGERKSWGTAQQTEEGWESEWVIWEHAGDKVLRESGADGTDCDGRLSTFNEYVCPLNKLHWGGWGGEGIGRFPEWEKLDSSQRDYAAEAAGY